MKDLDPSPGVWEWAVEGRDLDPDDTIVLRYAGELYRRARAVQVARVREDEARESLLESLFALLDEMREEDGDGSTTDR